jgi:hypothetical protein
LRVFFYQVVDDAPREAEPGRLRFDKAVPAQKLCRKHPVHEEGFVTLAAVPVGQRNHRPARGNLWRHPFDHG